MNDSVETERLYGPVTWTNPQKDMPHPHQPILAPVDYAETQNVARAKKNKEEFDMDLAALINDQNKVRSFVDCLLQDMCTGYGERLRDMLMEALSRDCNTCTESQQGLISKAANYLMKENPDAWQKIVQKYDPQGKLKEIAPRTLM